MNEPSFFQAVADTPLLARALIAGALAGISCALLSPFVVLRRMAFVGDGMAHAAFGGIGLGLFLISSAHYDDLSVQAVTLLFCLALGAAVGVVSRKTGESTLSEDSAIGIAFSVSMALGALLIALRQQHNPQYVPAMDAYLFGSVLNIGPADVYTLAGLAVLLLALLLIFQKELLFYSFDARLAEISGINVGAIHYGFMLLLVLTVVLCSRVVGIVLVSASLVLPGAIALRLSKRLFPATAIAALIGLVSFELGLYASYVHQVHPGSAIVLIQFAVLVLASTWEALTHAKPTAS